MTIDTPTSTPNFVNPKQILSQMDIKEGDIVADLGCGSGFLTLAAAEIVGEPGTVYAADIQKTVLSALQSKIKLQGTRGIKTIWADLEIPGSTKIKENTVDLVILASTLYQTKEHDKILQETYRITKEGGQVLIVDWEKTNVPLGPGVKFRVLKDDIRQKAETAGLKFTKEIEVDQYHYGLVLEK